MIRGENSMKKNVCITAAMVLGKTLTISSMVSAPLMFIGGLVLALSQDLRLSVVLVVTIPMLVIISVAFLISVLPYYKKQQIKMDELTTVVNDEIFGVRVVKAFSREAFEEDKMTKIASELSSINTKIAQKTAMLQPLFTVLVNISSIVLLWIGSSFATSGDFRIGDVIAFITYVSMILTATLTASLVFLMLPRAEVSADRIQEIFDTASSVAECENPVPMPESGSGASLEFKNVDFSYAKDEENDGGMFVTAWIGFMNIETGVISYVHAGHTKPVITGGGGTQFVSKKKNFLLGGRKNIEYIRQEITLGEGEALFLYTDGVTEARNTDGELYGEERLLKLLEEKTKTLDASDRNRYAESVCRFVTDDVRSFAYGAEQSDDITMLCLYRRKV